MRKATWQAHMAEMGLVTTITRTPESREAALASLAHMKDCWICKMRRRTFRANRNRVIEVKVNGKRLVLRRDKATLLNGQSGEFDALAFSPGGFVGHTSGLQRYRYERGNYPHEVTATWRPKHRSFYLGIARVVGGRSEHYDFNF